MTIRLYLTPLPETTSETAADQIGSDIQQAGLLDTGGTAVENIATENVDFRKQGRIQFGPTLSRKAAEELDSLSESSYTALPLYSSDGSLARKRGYYEVTRADVEPAQESRDDVYQYDVQLANAGTREDSRRAVRTNPQEVDSVYPDAGAAALVGIPDSATDVRWYDDANGSEPATAVETVQAEFGTVARYDPADAAGDTPALTYDLAFSDDGPTDVRVYDTRDRAKFAPTVSGGEVNTWVHAYHEGYQFDGAAVIDSGRLRIVVGGELHVAIDNEGETSTALRDDIAAANWNPTTEAWENIDLLTGTNWALSTWSFTRIRAARVELRTVWSDGTEETVLDCTIRRGADEAVWTVPENETEPPEEVEDILSPIGRAVSELAFGVQGLIDRDKRDA